MIKTIQLDRDFLGGTSLIINWSYQEMKPHLEKLREIVGEEQFERLTNNKISQEPGYVSVIVGSGEFSYLFEKEKIQDYYKKFNEVSSLEIDDIRLKSVCVQSHQENISYYVVVLSQKLESVRSFLKLPEKLFYINLGFYPRDVWDKKNIEILEGAPIFLKLLAKEYYKEDNFEFVKLLKNYPFDLQTEIFMVKLTDNLTNFRDTKGNYFTLSEVFGNLLITNIWTDSEIKPFLSNTIIERKLKNIK